MSSRAIRRHHRARMVARARHIVRRWYGSHDHTKADKYAVKVADYLAVCSCYSCGNPRRHYGFTVYSLRSQALTIQERRAVLEFKEWEV